MGDFGHTKDELVGGSLWSRMRTWITSSKTEAVSIEENDAFEAEVAGLVPSDLVLCNNCLG